MSRQLKSYMGIMDVISKPEMTLYPFSVRMVGPSCSCRLDTEMRQQDDSVVQIHSNV